jgi:hypothetical protein
LFGIPGYYQVFGFYVWVVGTFVSIGANYQNDVLTFIRPANHSSAYAALGVIRMGENTSA